jgi:hypothetical protein
MTPARGVRSLVRGGAVAAGIAAATYGAWVVVAWLRYGRPAAAAPNQADAMLDRVMPLYDVVQRHHVRVAAPAPVTFAASSEIALMQSWPVRLIFRARERIMGATPQPSSAPQPFLSLARSIGWGLLAEAPRSQIVMGAVTQPWLADVVFHPLPPEEFVRFCEPGFVKIAWTIRADPLGDSHSIFRTETRAVATDPLARARFRRYWSLASPGIILIRWLMLNPVKTAAERRARELRQSLVSS